MDGPGRRSNRAGMEAYFAERAASIEAAGGHPDPAHIDALRIRYGMEFARRPIRVVTHLLNATCSLALRIGRGLGEGRSRPSYGAAAVVNVHVKMLVFPVPEKFNTFNTFNTFDATPPLPARRAGYLEPVMDFGRRR